MADRIGGCHEHDVMSYETGIALHAAISDHFFTGYEVRPVPFLVASLVHRRKVDMNRSRASATEGDELSLQVYDSYHGNIKKSIEFAVGKFGFCHLFDLQ